MNPQLTGILQRIAQQDHLAMIELHDQTRQPLAAYIRKLVNDPWLSEEVLQDVYTHVWLHASAYSIDRGAPAAWLYMIARSRAVDSLRRRKRDAAVCVLDERTPSDPSSDVGSAPREIWWHTVLRRGVRELPAAQQRVIKLAFFEGYSHSEIAAATGMPLGTVKARIRMALGKLRDALPEGSTAGKSPSALPFAA